MAEDVYIKSPGPYGDFLEYVQKNVRHWRPDIQDREIQDYCVSTWNGCMGDLEASKSYFHVCLKEQGMRNRDLFDKGGGYGYSGARSKVVYRATEHHSHRWIRLHPYATNEALAWWFYRYLKANPVWWYSSPDPEKCRKYQEDIDAIKIYCERSS